MISTQILVLQLSGDKEWRHCRTKRSASCTTYEDADLDDLACETVVLEPGDALFLPRGVVHGAVAVDAASVFPEGEARDGLIALCHIVLSRSS